MAAISVDSLKDDTVPPSLPNINSFAETQSETEFPEAIQIKDIAMFPTQNNQTSLVFLPEGKGILLF